MTTALAKATSATETVVSAQAVTKVFKDFWMRPRAVAVDGLDLEIRRHEIFGLLGPNGSGKSTTIKMLLGLLFPTRGRIGIFGKLPGDVATKRRIGYLPEESYLYRFLDARETLDYYGRLLGLPRATRRKRIDMLLDMVGLTGVGRRAVGEFSKGMQRRIGLAQALIGDPDLLILDEPTTGLDPIGTRQIKDLILELGRREKTVLLSSHLLADVEDVCDRACILYGGKKQTEGTLDDLLGTPRRRLEDLFLDIVERAQTTGAATHGARMGGPVAEFLSASDDEPQAEAPEPTVSRPQAKEQAPARRAPPEPPAEKTKASGAKAKEAKATPEPAAPAPKEAPRPPAVEPVKPLRAVEPVEPVELPTKRTLEEPSLEIVPSAGTEKSAPTSASEIDRSLIDALIQGKSTGDPT